MTKKTLRPDSMEAQVAVIYDRVEHIQGVLPVVARHDRELLVGKIVGLVLLAIAAVKYPVIIEAFGRMIQ